MSRNYCNVMYYRAMWSLAFKEIDLSTRLTQQLFIKMSEAGEVQDARHQAKWMRIHLQFYKGKARRDGNLDKQDKTAQTLTDLADLADRHSSSIMADATVP